MSNTARRTVTGGLPDELHLGCGEDYREKMWNVDRVATVDPDQVFDIGSAEWPLPSDHFRGILANHVLEHLRDPKPALREMARVGRAGARIIIRTPIGLDAYADPGHERIWTWRTPEILIDRHWHGVGGLRLVDRTVDLWVHHPDGDYRQEFDEWIQSHLDKHGPGPWCHCLPHTSGEQTTVLEVIDDA